MSGSDASSAGVKKPKRTRAKRTETPCQSVPASFAGKAFYSVSTAIGNDYVPIDNLSQEHVIVHLDTRGDCDDKVVPYDGACMTNGEFQNFATPAAAPTAPSEQQQQQQQQQPSRVDQESVRTILGEFQKRTEDKTWPNGTNVLCHWCCHPFETPPVSLPCRIVQRGGVCEEGREDLKWEVTGCYCSFACAAAHNFEVNSGSDDMWEVYSLLNCMYQDSVEEDAPATNGRLLPAPPRIALQAFGGYMDIQQFRSKNTVFVDHIRPPMVFVPQQIEEVSEANVPKPLRFIPLDTDHIARIKERLQLKRSKPVINSTHTLDHMMNLRIE